MRLVVKDGQDWEFIENPPWLGTLAKPAASFQTSPRGRLRVFDWTGAQTSKRGAFGVFFRLIDVTTKQPILDENKQPQRAGAIVSIDSDKTITVDSKMPAQVIEVPYGWTLEVRLPEPEVNHEWRLDLPNGQRHDPFLPTSALKGFAAAGGRRLPNHVYRFIPTDFESGATTFKFVSTALAAEAANNPRSYPDGPRIELRAAMF